MEFLLDFILHIDPVSYTHLDVYKRQVEHRVGNSGMAVLLDAGMKTGIHPGKKKVAGERLARLALVKTYGMKGVTAESPYYAGMEVKNDTVIVSFDRAPMLSLIHILLFLRKTDN